MLSFFTIERRLALVIALVAALVLWLAAQVPEPSTFMVVGPRLFPYVLGGAMLLSAVLLFTLPTPRIVPAASEQVVAEHTDAAGVEGVGDADEGATLEWRRTLILMGITAVFVAAFEPLGFVVSTAAFIVAASWVLGSRNWVRDVIAAVSVAGGVYYLFTQLLHVRLPGFPFGLL